MYNTNQILYLISALSASQKAMFYAKDYKSAAEFFEANNQMPFNATLTLLIAVGEEVKKIHTDMLKVEPTIPWLKIADMRNVLAHDYEVPILT